MPLDRIIELRRLLGNEKPSAAKISKPMEPTMELPAAKISMPMDQTMKLQRLLDMPTEVKIIVLRYVFQSASCQPLLALVQSALAPVISYDAVNLLKRHSTTYSHDATIYLLGGEVKNLLTTMITVSSWNRHTRPSNWSILDLLSWKSDKIRPLRPPRGMDTFYFLSNWLYLLSEAQEYLRGFARENDWDDAYLEIPQKRPDEIWLQYPKRSSLLPFIQFQLLFRLSLIDVEAARVFIATLDCSDIEEVRWVNEHLKKGCQTVLQRKYGSKGWWMGEQVGWWWPSPVADGKLLWRSVWCGGMVDGGGVGKGAAQLTPDIRDVTDERRTPTISRLLEPCCTRSIGTIRFEHLVSPFIFIKEKQVKKVKLTRFGRLKLWMRSCGGKHVAG